MTSRISLPIQWFGTLLLGVLLGFSYQPLNTRVLPVFVPTSGAAPMSTSAAAPTKTLLSEKFLYVRVKIYPSQPPKIEKVSWVAFSEQEDYAEGKNKIELLDGSGAILYARFFSIKENDMPDLPQSDDSQTLLFFLPEVAGGSELVVTTPSGKDSHAVPPK